MGQYAEDAKQLLRLVGGKENIAAVSHSSIPPPELQTCLNIFFTML